MKRLLTTDKIGRVTLAYTVDSYDDDVRLVERTFTCPIDGGYVREYRNGDWTQVCDRLSRTGSTLSCSSRSQLITTIRHEYRAMRRAEKRDT